MGSTFGVEAGAGCFEGVGEVVVGLAFVFVEEELVCADGERECEIAEGFDGGLVGAGFIAADVGDVESGCATRACWVRPAFLRGRRRAGRRRRWRP